MTMYSPKELKHEARMAIKADAKAAKVKAKLIGWHLDIRNAGGRLDCVALVAHGERADGLRFDVNIAI